MGHEDVCDVKIFIIADSARVTFVLANEKASVEHHRGYVRTSKERKDKNFVTSLVRLAFCRSPKRCHAFMNMNATLTTFNPTYLTSSHRMESQMFEYILLTTVKPSKQMLFCREFSVSFFLFFVS